MSNRLDDQFISCKPDALCNALNKRKNVDEAEMSQRILHSMASTLVFAKLQNKTAATSSGCTDFSNPMYGYTIIGQHCRKASQS
jgi:hypothetical protein